MRKLILYILRALPKIVNMSMALSPLISAKDSPEKETQWAAILFFSSIVALASAYQTDRTEPRLSESEEDLSRALGTPQLTILSLLNDEPPRGLRRQNRRFNIFQITPKTVLPSPVATPTASPKALALSIAVNTLGFLAATAPFCSSLFLLFANNPLAFYFIAALFILVTGSKNILCEAPPAQDRITLNLQPMTWPEKIPPALIKLLLAAYARLDALLAGGSSGKLIHDFLLPETLGLIRFLIAMPVVLAIYFTVKTLNESFDCAKGLLRYVDKLSRTDISEILRGAKELPARRATAADCLLNGVNRAEKALFEITPFARDNKLWLKTMTFAAYMSRQAFLGIKISDHLELNTPFSILIIIGCLAGAVAPAWSAVRLKIRAIPDDHMFNQESIVYAAFKTCMHSIRTCRNNTPQLPSSSRDNAPQQPFSPGDSTTLNPMFRHARRPQLPSPHSTTTQPS